jgi:hypothetical protein
METWNPTEKKGRIDVGIITKIFGWISHPSIDTETDPIDWVSGLVLVIIAAFLWSRVVKQVVEG